VRVVVSTELLGTGAEVPFSETTVSTVNLDDSLVVHRHNSVGHEKLQKG
jgi:hypothetical protein